MNWQWPIAHTPSPAASFCRSLQSYSHLEVEIHAGIEMVSPMVFPAGELLHFLTA
jgi:hypothetical protein